MLPGDAIWDPSDAEARQRGSGEGRAVVGLEAPLRTDRDDPVAVHELPTCVNADGSSRMTTAVRMAR